MFQRLIEINNVSKQFISSAAVNTPALHNINLVINRGEFLVIVGKSGSGKSTLLRLIAGLECPSTGTIQVQNASQEKIGFIFQDNTIFPWFTVKRNIAFSMELAGINANVRDKRSEELAALVGLKLSDLTKYPKELSGGEKRRVAIAMALAHDSRILLLDEPTTALDDLNKWNFQNLMQTIWLEKKITCIMVTHDIEEALFLGDRIAVLSAGSIKNLINVNLSRPRTNKDRGDAQMQILRTSTRELL